MYVYDSIINLCKICIYMKFILYFIIYFSVIYMLLFKQKNRTG